MTPAILAMAKAGHNVTVFHADVFKHHIRENNVTDESDLVDINQVHQTKLFGLYKWIPGSNDLLKFWKTVHSQCKLVGINHSFIGFYLKLKLNLKLN